MYIFAQELGNTIVRSAGQTDQGKALWDKGLQGGFAFWREIVKGMGDGYKLWLNSPQEPSLN